MPLLFEDFYVSSERNYSELDDELGIIFVRFVVKEYGLLVWARITNPRYPQKRFKFISERSGFPKHTK
jgi:hypothetical protein